jgi:hypothetical protein
MECLVVDPEHDTERETTGLDFELVLPVLRRMADNRA